MYFRQVFTRSKKYKSQSDEELLSLYKSNPDDEVWAELYERYMPLVYGACLHILRDKKKSEDAAMYLFESLPDYLLKYKIEQFRSWLFTVTRNHCYQLTKKEVRDLRTAYEFIQDAPVESETEQIRSTEYLPSCLESLKTEQQQCIELFYLQQKSYKEIVEITGFSLLQVKSYIQNGKRNLRLCIESKQ